MDIVKAVFIVFIVLILSVVSGKVVMKVIDSGAFRPVSGDTLTITETDTIIKTIDVLGEFGARLEDGTMLRQCGVTGDNYIQVCWRGQRYTLMISGMACNLPKQKLGKGTPTLEQLSFYRTMNCIR